VGLTPQLLPAIISINLSHGAKRMAAQQVIVKRLSSIENFGCMNVLCSDKTGTITDGEVRLKGAFDLSGAESNDILLLAYLNAFFETGYASPIDEAIKKEAQFDVSTYEKLDEVPYDFLRKRLSVFVKHEGKGLVVAKGALKNIMEVCSHAKLADGRLVAASEAASEVNARLQEFSRQGLRVLGMCVKEMDPAEPLTRDKESDMTLVGLLAFWDPPKSGVKQTIANLKDLGVSLKIITGDNALIAETVAKDIGIDEPHILTGSDLAKLSDEALPQKAQQAHIFAEVEPNQKERIILAVKKAGNVVGYMGDGINDASALRAADVSISVDQAVDVAKEAADIVLLEKDLAVLEHGVREGRKTFANTLKYVFMATSANFGNMFSMAGASLFLSFLPLLPKQILLTNLLTDMPEMSIATDNVDEDAVDKPRRWDIRFIRNFMIVFGLLSSVFDYLTFGVLLWVLNATPAQFRTGWFLESIVSATMIVLVIRTRRPCISSRPGKGLFWATIAVILITHWLPYSPVAGVMGFEALPMSFLAAMWIIVGLYVVSAEIAKSLFYKKVNF
jgi:Mg2+-importing ATPase